MSAKKKQRGRPKTNKIETKKEETKMEEPKSQKRIARTYYSTDDKCGFDIQIVGEDGKPVFKINSHGDRQYLMGQPVYETIAMGFTSWKRAKNAKYLSIYNLKADSPTYDLEYKRLEQLAADPIVSVMTSKDYEKNRNPEAFEHKQSIAAKDKLLGDQNAEISDMKKTIERLTNKNKDE